MGETIPDGFPAWSRAARISDYGGALDKQDCTTETVPYAWTWYEHLTTELERQSSLFTRDRTGMVYARKVALARAIAGAQRAQERLMWSAFPGTSDETLGRWVEVMALSVHPRDGVHQIRRRAAARYMAARGNAAPTQEAIAAEQLGRVYVRIWRAEGSDLDNPPPLTYWPTINAGSALLDVSGNGAWLSERSHVTIEVTQPPTMSDEEFLHLVNVELFETFDDLLPSTATFNWAIDVSTGFLLDISRMDFTGFGYA